MLIKIAKAPYFEHSHCNSFKILDHITEIEDYTTQPIEYTSNDTLEKFLYCTVMDASEIKILDEDRLSSFVRNPNSASDSTEPFEKLSEQRVYRINNLTFRRGDKTTTIYFDTIAYICNDEGKTLEKCFAGGILNK